MTRRKKSSPNKSKGKSKRLYIIGLCSTLLMIIVIIGMIKPQSFRTAYHKIERAIFKNPQNSSVTFPENEIVGIDISTYQNNINWDSVTFKINPETKRLTKDPNGENRKVEFVLAKATEGITIKDPKYLQNKKGAEENGYLFGAYHYFSVTSDAKQQALHYIETSDLKEGNLIPVLDVEYQGKLSKEELRKRVLIWLHTVENKYNCKPIIYTYVNFQDNIFDTEEFKNYYFWLAHYGVNQPKNECKFWQFTEEGVVYGITGYVDIDIFQGSRRELNKLKLQTPQK